MFQKLFKKNPDNSDIFKQLIHRLSDMPVEDLEKVDKLLDIFFENGDTVQETLIQINTQTDTSLEEAIEEAKNQLHKEQLEKNLERFRKNKK
ncbi:hypothetical protein DW726_04990 [Streptococcus gordonii]|uniref:hypothetical protein n=1 Tax=Streptococcus gordonii TaxID=1302 RepID=UPI000E4DE699|nr:hypothetical protein [Streptococcus gordonii]RHE64448.1 hypothetical protein DW726_04990 [Streptococcus gordonii]